MTPMGPAGIRDEPNTDPIPAGTEPGGTVGSTGDALFTNEARAAWSEHEAEASQEAIAVERIDDPAEVAAMLRSIADGTRRQLLSALPQGEYSVEMLRSSWDVDLAMLARGVDVRVVYPAETARKPAFLQYLSDFANAGAAVRISAKVPHRIVVSDRRTAVVPVHPEHPSRAALVMREPVVVASVCAQFTTLWRTAWPVGVSVKNGLDVDLIRDTLTALATWPTDETAARHLGTSVRTLRRRIAAIMELLGASSRFEAGLKAQEGGWI